MGIRGPLQAEDINNRGARSVHGSGQEFLGKVMETLTTGEFGFRRKERERKTKEDQQPEVQEFGDFMPGDRWQKNKKKKEKRGRKGLCSYRLKFSARATNPRNHELGMGMG